MHRPNFVGNPLVYSAPGITTLSNANVDAISFPTSSTNVYANTHSATVPTSFNERVYRNTATDLDLAINNNFCVGLFLSANQDKKNVVYQCNGYCAFTTNVSAQPYAIFGRASSSTITASVTAPDNLLSTYAFLPITTGGSTRNCSVNVDVLKIYDSSNAYPYFFGFMFTNGPSLSTIAALVCSLSFRAYVDEIDAHQPSR